MNIGIIMGYNGIIYIWVNSNDLTVLPKPGIMVNKGNSPNMVQHFRLVKYYNLPRWMLFLAVEYKGVSINGGCQKMDGL